MNQAEIMANRDRISYMQSNYFDMSQMEIGIEASELMQAMSHKECNSRMVAKAISNMTGHSVTPDQVTQMLVSTGMPKIYATPAVRRFLGL